MKFAEALLFRSSDGARRSLRVEADSVGLEFTDNTYLGVVEIPPRPPFGRDPEGCLFYNNLQDFKTQSGSSRYTVTQEKNPADMRDCLRVKFYDGTSGACYAQFLSHDRFKVVTQTVMNGINQPGQWAELNIGHATAIITKNYNGVTITAKSIGWKATISAGIFNSQNFTVEGNLSFKDIDQIGSGTIASCNNDRLLFFQPGWQTDFIAFFIPHDFSPGALGFDQSTSSSFSDTELKNGVSWARI